MYYINGKGHKLKLRRNTNHLTNHTKSNKITPLVIYELGGGHSHIHTNTHITINVISKNQTHAGRRPARIWFKRCKQNSTFLQQDNFGSQCCQLIIMHNFNMLVLICLGSIDVLPPKNQALHV